MSAMHTVLTTSDVPPYWLIYTSNHYLDPNVLLHVQSLVEMVVYIHVQM